MGEAFETGELLGWVAFGRGVLGGELMGGGLLEEHLSPPILLRYIGPVLLVLQV